MIEHVPTSILCAERCHLGERPTYDVAIDTVWWFDILKDRLFEAHLESGRIRIHALGKMASALARIELPRFRRPRPVTSLRHVGLARYERGRTSRRSGTWANLRTGLLPTRPRGAGRQTRKLGRREPQET